MRLLRIAVIHSFYSRQQASGENNVVESQVKVLRDAGHDVLLLSQETDNLTPDRFYALKVALSVPTGRGWNPIAELKAFDPDVVLLHNLFPNIGTDWMTKWHGPIISFLHNYRHSCANGTLFRDGRICVECPTNGALNGLIHACYRDSKLATLPLTLRQTIPRARRPELSRPDMFIALSKTSAQMVKSLGIADPARTTVIPNFIPDTYSTYDWSTPSISEKWVTAGRLSREKGFLNLAQFWPNTHSLDIIGDGPDFKRLQDLTDKKPNIRLLGRLEHAEYLPLLSSYQGAIFPSLWSEPFGLTAAEFLSAALPVITTANNAVADMILKSEAGVICNELTEPVLRASLKKIEMNQQEYSTKARNYFLGEFTSESWLKAMSAVFRELKLER